MTGTGLQRNVLFIMCDQLRFDYLSCFGHPHLETPNIDGLAARGVRFMRAYVQSPICVPSRMSFYTGRYVHAHGCTWNQIPLRVGEPTLGDHLRSLGVRTALAGKTHMSADLAGMARLGIDPASHMGILIAQCGFEPFERHDGLHPDRQVKRPAYESYLRAHGFDAPNPWHEWANAAAGEDGAVLSGWLMENADKPARIPAEHSETAYMTGRAMDFMEEAGDQDWCLHLSYIKPHWPYIAPAPYHALYGANQMLPAVRSQAERESAPPVFAAFMQEVVSRTMSDDAVRARAVPAYMGLVKEIDDQLGRLFGFMEERGLLENTMIAFTSDHGDYLGDHWLGEKELFHEPSVRFPLIVADPRGDADATRGTVSDALVEAVDLAPTFIEYFGGTPPGEILEGRAHGHGVRRPLEIRHGRRFSADVVRSGVRPGGTDGPSHDDRTRARAGPPARGDLRLAAAPSQPHHHQRPRDRTALRTGTARRHRHRLLGPGSGRPGSEARPALRLDQADRATAINASANGPICASVRPATFMRPAPTI